VKEGDIIFLPEISRMFNISQGTLRRKSWRQKSGIPLRKVGRRLCGLRPELEKWFKGLNG